MLLPFSDRLQRTTHFDPEMARLADRHYSRVRVGSPQYAPPGKMLVLRDALGTVLFVWSWQQYRKDGQTGYNCSIFRNESTRVSSGIILEAEQAAVTLWGSGRAFTYVDETHVKSNNPGYCFKVAGWVLRGKSKTGKLLFVKYL